MQQGDYSSSYYQYHHPPHLQNPNPNPNSNLPNPIDYQSSTTYASAPPFAPNYSSSSSDYPNYQQPAYPPYLPNSDHLPQIPPTAPSYQQPNPPNPNYQSFNPPPPPPPPHQPFNSAPEHPPPSLPYSAPPQQSPYYPSYDHHQPTNYSPIIPTSNPNPNPNPSSFSPPPHSVYEPTYDTNLKFDHRSSYLDENSNRYGVQPSIGRSHSEPAVDFYDKRSDSGHLYGRSHIQDDDVRGQNIYPYEGGKVEPYGARGTGKSSSFSAAFDDYGRSLSLSAKDQAGLNKVLKAVPKVEAQQDVKNGVQKFRVKLLAETGGQTPMDVLCQIGLDGIRMLDPSSARTLRIYPLETITRSEVLDSSIFAFWSKSTVDIEPRRIRLKSNSYTTNTILDTVTAATIQLKEIGGKDSFSSRQLDPSKQSEQYTEKKKGFTDWVNLIKPGNEEKDHWVPDEAVTKCTACGTDFGAFVRRHHCRNCGDIFCDKCTHGRIALTAEENAQPVRVCDRCLAEVTQRLSNAKETASKPAALCSHEDLAKKLQEEMDKNRKTASGSKSSDGSGRRMREVACPTCTVHLQVQVPTSGSETIECGVCQHPFLVSAH